MACGLQFQRLEYLAVLILSQISQSEGSLTMADMVTVLWHMNTYTSAATDFMAVKNQITLNFNSNPQYRKDIKAWCKKNALPVSMGIDWLAQDGLNKRNMRSAFTGLNSEQRLNELEAAIGKARDWASKKMGIPNLVFVAPEYLFAQDGYRHLLPFDQIATIKARLKTISKRYHQVLLFPGTVAFRQPIADNSVKARVSLYEDINFWKAKKNDNLAQWVDSINREKIHKVAMRGPTFDMAQNKLFAYLNGKKLMEYTKRGDFHEVTEQDATGNEVYVPGKRTGRLEAFDRSFGTEICLDHNMGYAKASSTHYPDIHVIMSAAVKPKEENEGTQGHNPGKTGFVIHASSDKDYTGVVQWRDGKRSTVTSIWESSTGYGGTLFGYKLSFNDKGSDQGLQGVQGKVAAMKQLYESKGKPVVT
jgi:hypothetical protein